MNFRTLMGETESATANATASQSTDESALELAAGGFSPETEVVTTDGLATVADLAAGDTLYALDPVTGLVKQKPVTTVQAVAYEGEVVELQTRRCDVRVAADHRIPFHTKSISRTRFTRAGDRMERCEYRFVNEWQPAPRPQLTSVDITELVDDDEICAATDVHGHTFRAALPDGCEPIRRNSHIGYYFDPETFKRYQSAIEAAADHVSIHPEPNCHRRPYRFDGEDFLRLLGWYITEGDVYWPESSDTAEVKLAQETDEHRHSIASLLDRMGLDGYRDEHGCRFSSTVFGRLLENLCGAGCYNKQIPAFVWTLSPAQLQILLEVLLAGDGNDRKTYYTVSDRLASDVLRLCLEVGVKPRYSCRDGMWQIFVRQGNDGFHSRKHVTRFEASEDLYRLTVADYSSIIAGRNGKFQWIGISVVS